MWFLLYVEEMFKIVVFKVWVGRGVEGSKIFIFYFEWEDFRIGDGNELCICIVIFRIIFKDILRSNIFNIL